MRRSLRWTWLLVLAACAPGSGGLRSPHRMPASGGGVLDTLPSFLEAMRTQPSAEEAFLSYEQAHLPLLRGSGLWIEDPGDVKLRRLAASAEAVVTLVERFEPEALGAVRQVQRELGSLGLGAPAAGVALVVSRSDLPHGWDTEGGRPVLVLNARHPDHTQGGELRGLVARELAWAQHRAQNPTAGGLGPLAERLYREGASRFAARQLVPDLLEHEVLGLAEPQLGQLRRRTALVAQELLTVLDSAQRTEAARFFDADLKDPLVPSGAGPFTADLVYQALGLALRSSQAPLRLPPGEFLDLARAELTRLAAGP